IYALASIALFFLLTLFQSKPELDLFLRSGRLLDSNWMKEGWFLPWQNLLQLIAPDIFGNPSTLNYWGVWNYGEFIGYIGAAGIMLASVAIFFGKKKIFVWKASLLILLLFTLPNPISKLIYQLNTPLISSLQPTRLMGMIDFVLVLLAVFGIGILTKLKAREVNKLSVLWIIFIIGIWLSLLIFIVNSSGTLADNLEISKRNLILPTILIFSNLTFFNLLARIKKEKYKRIVVLSIIAISIFDLFRFGWKFTPFTPKDLFFPSTKIISYLSSQKKPFRIMTLDDKILPANSNAYYGIESVSGYDPIILFRYEEFIASVERGKPNIDKPFGFNRIINPKNYKSPLLPLLNVKYLLTLDEVGEDGFDLVMEEGRSKVYKNENYLPRVFMVSEVINIFDNQQTIDRLYQSGFDLKTQAIVDGHVAIGKKEFDPSEKIVILSYKGDKIEFQTSIITDRFVVITNSYDLGWKAYVNGKEVKVYRTDYAFCGILVPQGVKKIEFIYKP
ncbi:YfhO family protein, partial [Patescibacteria group bacterium]